MNLPFNPPDTLVSGTITTVDISGVPATPTAGSFQQIVLGGHKSCSITISGSWTGNILVESSTDNGTVWVVCWLQTIAASAVSTLMAQVNSITANGSFTIANVSGTTHYRARATSFAGGPATIKLTATEQPPVPTLTFSNIIQNVLASLINSSVVNIAALAQFVGRAESTLGVNAIQISLHADQNMTVYIDQAPGLVALAGTVVVTLTNTITGTLFTTGSRPVIVGDEIFVGSDSVKVVLTVSDTVITVSGGLTNGTGIMAQVYAWDINDNYDYNKISNNFGITVTAVSSFFRARLVNKSSSTSTTFMRMQCCLCPVAEALPRSLSSKGFLRSEINGLRDNFGFQGQFSPMRDLRVAQPYRMVGATFPSAALDTNFWTGTNTGSAPAVSVAGGVVTVHSGTSINGTGNLASATSGRFIFAHAHNYRGLIRLPILAAANNTRLWGAATITGTPATVVDGVYFEYNGTTQTLACCCRNAGGTVKRDSAGTKINLDTRFILI